MADQGVHNKGKVSHLLTIHGTTIRQPGARAPHQLGVGERHGGLLKEIMRRVIHERRIHGAEEISALCSEATRVKNTLLNQHGYSPSQWVMGFQPGDVTSLANNDPNEQLGNHQVLIDAEDGAQDIYAKQLLIRQWAKEAYIRMDTSQRVRRALLRKSVPMRGPFKTGDLVCFNKKNKWYGPARVLTAEGKSSLWLLHSGVAVLVAETSCRPATTSEVLKKHCLELRPDRKRKRELLLDMDDDEELPFSDDYIHEQGFSGGQRDQVPFVDFEMAGETGVAANPEGAVDGQGQSPLSPPAPTPLFENDNPDLPAPPPGLAGPPPMIAEDDVMTSAEAMTRVSTQSSQPEAEVTPVPSTSTINATGSSTLPTATPEEVTPLTRSLRADPDRLDGIFSRRPPSSSDSFMAQKTGRKYKKRTQKVGAGRELHFMKETPERQKKLLVTREKEWSKWMHYSDGRLADEEEVNKMKDENPNLRVIPTRWVDTDKIEIGEEERLKSRLVVRGDLEDSSLMRCDSPTCSLTMLSVVLTLAACRNSSLWSGDISAAFLQGSKLNRVLVLSLPKDGVPGVPPNITTSSAALSTELVMHPVAGGRTLMAQFARRALSLFPMNPEHTLCWRTMANWLDFSSPTLMI